MEPGLREFKSNMELFGVNPTLLYTDKFCSDMDFMARMFPSLEDAVADSSTAVSLKLPANCTVHYLNNEVDIEMYLRPLLAQVQCLSSNTLMAIGLDCEWVVNSHVSIIQIAVKFNEKVTIYVVNLNSLRKGQNNYLPTVLDELLSHEQVMKVGSCITSIDCRKLQEDWNCGITEAQCRELWKEAKAVGLIEKRLSLAKMCRVVLKRELPKEENIRCSNWGATKLTQEQIDYAALDAYASLKIFIECSKYVPQSPFSLSTSSSSVDDDSDDSNENGSEDATTIPNVRQDPIHVMWRITRPIPEQHFKKKEFMCALRDAIFIVNDQDKENVEQYLNEIGLKYEDKFKKDPKWILQRVQRKIPMPHLLIQRLESLKKKYSAKDYYDPKYGPLFNKNVIDAFQTMLKHAEKGCLSDPKRICIYYNIGKDRNGLQLYRCTRGTNEVECVHQKLEMKVGSWSASPELATLGIIY